MRNLPSNNSVGIEDLWKVMTRINIGQTFNEEGPQMLRTIEQHTTRRRKTELLELLRMIDGGNQIIQRQLNTLLFYPSFSS